MKQILTLALCLIPFTASAGTLESFFTKLEGHWEKRELDSYRETPAGEITHSVGTRFVADVKRVGDRWNFTEDVCWKEEDKPEVCSEGAVSYVVDGDRLLIAMGEAMIEVDVLEVDEDYLSMTFSSEDSSFLANLTFDNGELAQDSLSESADGTKEYQIFRLTKQSVGKKLPAQL